MIGPEIVVFDTDPEKVQKLQSSLHLPFLTFAVGTGPEVKRSKHLDAMWLTPMQAERYGAMPPFPLHIAQILVTPEHEVQKGFPALVITGVAISREDPKDLRWQLHLIVSSLTSAIKDAEEKGTFSVRTVGMLPDHLLLHKLAVEEASPIIEAAYRQHYPLMQSPE